MTMGSLPQMLKSAKPYLCAIFIQFGFAGMSIIFKFALDKGASQHVLIVYRHVIATLVIAPFALAFDRNRRPTMTVSLLAKIMLLGLLEPVIDQNLYYTGMKYTTATFTTALSNVAPAFAFLLAWVSKQEEVNIRRLHSQAKILGTVVSVVGAMMMTLVKGPMLPWTKGGTDQDSTSCASDNHNIVTGAIMILISCLCWSSFVVLQAFTLQSYPAELSLTVWICLFGAIEGTLLTLVLERHNPTAWSVHLDFKLLPAVYSGVICSGIGYYFQGLIVREKGPVFVTAFSPLGMIIVAIIGPLIHPETIYFGRVVGAVVIVVGLYLVLWGKSNDQDASTAQDEQQP